MAKYEDLSKEELIAKLKNLEAKKFGLMWDSEKEPEQVVTECASNLPVLDKDESRTINASDNDVRHILIEGDNYHSLKVLNYTHRGKINVIYIDPPYNTGNKDFCYNDHFVEKEDGYRHSKWLNFMDKRLRLAHSLLKDSGVIFISIDDNEFAQLKLLCDKHFDEKNFIGCLPTIMNLKGNNDDFGFSGTHEYTLVYAKNKTKCTINHFELDDEELDTWKEDEYGYYKKADTLRRTGQDAPRERRPKGWFPVFISIEEQKVYVTDNNLPLNENDIILFPINKAGEELSWSWGKSKITNEYYNLIITGDTTKGYNIYKKQRPQLGDIPTKKPKTLFYKPEHSNSTATNKLKEILGAKLFDSPKPVPLIKDFIYLGGDKNAIVLDFFAGSGTTGQAVLDLNREDDGSRQFILCTNNENEICSTVTYPRLEKVINGYTTPKSKNIDGLGGNLDYFTTSLIPINDINTIVDDERLKLAKQAGNMIAIKENTSLEVTLHNNYQVFTNISKSHHTAIYFSEDLNDFDELVDSLSDEQTVLYIYSYVRVDKSAYEYLGDNFVVKDIPQPIINIYKEINKEVRG